MLSEKMINKVHVNNEKESNSNEERKKIMPNVK